MFGNNTAMGKIEALATSVGVMEHTVAETALKNSTFVEFTMTPAWTLPEKTAARDHTPQDTEARTHHSLRALSLWFFSSLSSLSPAHYSIAVDITCE